MSDRPPEALCYRARHLGVPVAELIALYEPRIPRTAAWSMTGMTPPRRVSLGELKTRLATATGVSAVSMTDTDGTSISMREIDDDNVWAVSIRRSGGGISESWLATLVAILRDAATFTRLLSAAVERDPTSLTSFVPAPPLAAANHAVLVTDAQVAAAYDDPSTFWKMWNVEQLGAWKLCSRALADIDEDRWLARTFESTMALVRAARPGLTKYDSAYWDPEMAPWWEFGDLQDEKAGYPALAPIGYDDDERAYYFVGFIARTPLVHGGEEPRHVLIREIYDLRELVRAARVQTDRPVDSVRISFLEEWMARQERRPLLDAGARVYYGEDIEVTD